MNGTHLMKLRRKQDEDASSLKYIFAEPRVGYRMAEGETKETEIETFPHPSWRALVRRDGKQA